MRMVPILRLEGLGLILHKDVKVRFLKSAQILEQTFLTDPPTQLIGRTKNEENKFNKKIFKQIK